MLRKLNIAGLHFALEADKPYQIGRGLSCFASDLCGAYDVTVSLEGSAAITDNNGKLLVDEAMKWFHNPQEKKEFSIYIYDPTGNFAVYRMKVNRLWNDADITYLQGDKEIADSISGAIGEILFRNRILYHQGIVLHAAAIDWNGKAIAFSAPSGTGKTTQANLWKKYRKASILNADRPAIRLLDGVPYAFGTPWNGSSPKCKNQSIPLSAIIMLERAGSNHIERLKDREAVEQLMPRCFLPYYDKDMMNLAIDNIEKLVAVTPVYLLKCRPDKEAMELVYQCVK